MGVDQDDQRRPREQGWGRQTICSLSVHFSVSDSPPVGSSIVELRVLKHNKTFNSNGIRVSFDFSACSARQPLDWFFL